MIGQERPRVDGNSPCLGQPGEPRDEVGPVPVVAEDRGPLDPAHQHVVEGPRGVEPCMARHSTLRLPQSDQDCNVPYYVPY